MNTQDKTNLCVPLNQKAVVKFASELGYSLTKLDGEYRLSKRGTSEASAYYTNDLKDVLETVRAMAKADQYKRAARKIASRKTDVEIVRKLNCQLIIENLKTNWSVEETNRFIELLESGRICFSGDMTGFHVKSDFGIVDDCSR